MSSSTSIICCPIELEPRTLNQGQISHAREVAADVVDKMEPIDATTVFTEGMKPVRTSKEMKRSIEMADVRDRYEGGDVVSHEEKEQLIKDKPCQQCSCTTAVSDSPDLVVIKIKEPLSSPF